MYMHTYDGIKVGLLYNNAGYVKCIESDSQYTTFMLNTINATIFKLILPFGYWPGS